MVGTSAGVAGRMFNMRRVRELRVRELGVRFWDRRLEGDFEALELFVGGGPADLAELECGAFEDGRVEVVRVVEEPAGDGGVGSDGGGFEAEVDVVGDDLLIDGPGMVGDGREGCGQWDLGAFDLLHFEEAALEVVVGGGVFGVVVTGDEHDAGVVEVDGLVGVVGDDDADGKEAVGEVVEACVGRGLGCVAGVGGDGDVLGGVGLVRGVLRGGERRRDLARLVGVRGGAEQEKWEEGREAARHARWIILWGMRRGQSESEERRW